MQTNYVGIMYGIYCCVFVNPMSYEIGSAKIGHGSMTSSANYNILLGN